MIEKISKVQNIALKNQSTLHLNTSLPVSIKVTQKIGYNRYMLEFANNKLSTKSHKELKVGGNYWGEISNLKDNIIIKNLYEKPKICTSYTLVDGLDIIEKIINENSLEWFKEHILNKLSSQVIKDEFEIYTNMLLALQMNILHVPFLYNDTVGIFQFQKLSNSSILYLVFSNFTPLMFSFKNGNCNKIFTPFQKVLNQISKEFECECVISKVEPLWQNSKNIIDFKG